MKDIESISFVFSIILGIICVVTASCLFKESVVLNPLGISNTGYFVVGLLLLVQAYIDFSFLWDD